LCKIQARLAPIAKSRERKKGVRGAAKSALSPCIIEAHDVRYDLISCVNCSLVNCQSYSSRELSSSPLYICRYTTKPPPSFSLSLSLSPSRDGDGRWPPHGIALLAHGGGRCPMNALHFHTSPGGQRERLTRLFNPRSSYRLRLARSRFIPSRLRGTPDHSLVLTLLLDRCVNLRKIEGTSFSSLERNSLRDARTCKKWVVSLERYFTDQQISMLHFAVIYRM